jgi:ABC-type Fe3+-hydroxamate transport system substrate-binding protein
MLQKAFLDMMGREVTINHPPKRIISLVPSQTELLYDLGLANQIVGQTVFCIHPQTKFKNAVKIGGTKKVQFEKIHALKPDLIIGNKEENTKKIIDTLSQQYPVWMSDIFTIEDNFRMIKEIGTICQVEVKALEICQKISEEFQEIQKYTSRSCLYLIWKNPYMAAGGQTFINEMLKYAGFKNVLPKASRYPELTDDDILKLNPETILLSSEPFPFKEKHISELKQLLPKAKIHLVDGEMFSWYGSRILKAPEYFKNLRKILL